MIWIIIGLVISLYIWFFFISTLNKGKNITDYLIQSNRISFYKIYKIMKKGICYDYRTAEN